MIKNNFIATSTCYAFMPYTQEVWESLMLRQK